MRSKAHIKGHPLHPILVSFPISLLSGAFLLDILTLCTNEVSYARAGYYAEIGGLIAAVIAAIPGIIDYFHTVPPDSSAHKRATKHGLINSTAVFVFLTAFFIRYKSDNSLFFVTCLEGAGVILLGIAGWLGGTLVIRNQIGVDHRYAEAGKWKEEIIETKGNTVILKNTSELKVNQMRLLRVNDKRIVIGRTENGLVAFDDRCTHRGGTLADGAMICGTVQCPWHGSQFDLNTGEVKAGPAKENIRIYIINEENDSAQLLLS